MIDNKTRLYRLERLIKILEKVRDEKRPFGMGDWVLLRGGKSPSEVPLLDAPVETCGTASCALGWAARDPEFRALGLRFADDKDVIPTVYYDGYLSEHAGMEFFGLSYQMAIRLFMPTSYMPEDGERHDDIEIEEVIERVRELIGNFSNPPEIQF